MRGHANVVARSVPVNIEADSINAALLAPGCAAGERGVRRLRARGRARDDGQGRAEMHRDPPHLRAGAIRPTRSPRRLRPSSRAPRSAIRAQADTRMGPVVTRAPAGGGVRRHPAAGVRSAIVCGGADAPVLDGIDAAKIGVRRADLLQARGRRRRASAVHEVEVFGPAATIVPYRDEAGGRARWSRAAAARWSRRSTARTRTFSPAW